MTNQSELRTERIAKITARLRALPGALVADGSSIALGTGDDMRVVAMILAHEEDPEADATLAFITNAKADIEFLLLELSHTDAALRERTVELATQRETSKQINEATKIILAGQEALKRRIAQVDKELSQALLDKENSDRDAAAYRVALQVAKMGVPAGEARDALELLLVEANGGAALERELNSLRKKDASFRRWYLENRVDFEARRLPKPEDL